MSRRRRHSSPAPALPLEDEDLLRLPRLQALARRPLGPPLLPRRHHRRPPLLGFMTGKPRCCVLMLMSNVVLLVTFVLPLESMRFRRISERNGWDKTIHYAYRNFYTAGELGETLST
ncbi:hypothetical protein VPH35_107784 [Triticum aestivum]